MSSLIPSGVRPEPVLAIHHRYVFIRKFFEIKRPFFRTEKRRPELPLRRAGQRLRQLQQPREHRVQSGERRRIVRGALARAHRKRAPATTKKHISIQSFLCIWICAKPVLIKHRSFSARRWQKRRQKDVFRTNRPPAPARERSQIAPRSCVLGNDARRIRWRRSPTAGSGGALSRCPDRANVCKITDFKK